MAECALACGMFEDCNYYTFEEKYGHCVLFEDCESYDRTCETCKSGEKKCLVQLGMQRLLYRDRLKGWYVVARNFFLLLLNFSAWPYLAVA